MARAGFPLSPLWLEKLGTTFAMKAVQARRLQAAQLERRPRACSSTAGSSRASRSRDDADEEFRAADDDVEQRCTHACASCVVEDDSACKLRRSCRPLKRNSNVVDSASTPLESAAVKRTPASCGRPRLQCRNTECMAKSISLSQELTISKKECERLRHGAQGVVGDAACVSLRAEIWELRESNAVMDGVRRGAFRSLASVRGRFDSMSDEVKKYKDMCDIAQKDFAANVAELKASARRSEGAARRAARDASSLRSARLAGHGPERSRSSESRVKVAAGDCFRCRRTA
eukprot:6199669-Pleurochrysis_carterae.AAC.5